MTEKPDFREEVLIEYLTREQVLDRIASERFPALFKLTRPAGGAKDSDSAESVDHPSHYNSHPSGVECIDIVEAFNFNVGNAMKYLWRAGLKGDLTEDLKKAKWYIEREISRVEKANANKAGS